MMFIQTYHTDGLDPTFPFTVQDGKGENERQKGVTRTSLPPASFLLSNLYLTLPSLALLSLHPAQPEPEYWYQAADALPHPKHTHSLKIHTHCILGGDEEGGGRREAGPPFPCSFRACFGNEWQGLYCGALLVLLAKCYKCRESGPRHGRNTLDA